MTINLNQIRQELKLLKKIQHSIDTLIEVENSHKQRLEVLLTKKQTDSVKEDIVKIKDIISNLGTEQYIRRATEIETKYWSAINSLSPIDKTIILDGYINGTQYWKIGNKVGYSERSIQRRVPEIIKIIADYMQSDIQLGK